MEEEPNYESSGNGIEDSSSDSNTLRTVEEAKKIVLQKAQELSAAVAATSSSQDDSDSRPDTPQGNTYETFTEDIDINDCKNRYLLTKSQTQHEIKDAFSVDITTRGKYFPDRSKATSSEPALHLHISSTSKEALDNAVAKIHELMDKQVEPVTQEKPVYNPRAQPPPRQILTDKVYVDWEADRFFNIRAKIVGPGGAYVKHIQQQSNVRLQLKGKGSGYTESATGRESEEPLHVWLTTTQDEEALEKAKALLQDLLSKVKADYDQWKVNRGTNTASIGYSASHAHAQERNRFNDRSHFQVPPASAPVPSMPTSTHLASAASNMVPTAPPAPTPPTTIVSTPEQYAIYHQYYQQYYQHYYQQYVMMSSMHIPQQHSMHAYMQVPPSFPPPPHTPTSSASFGYPSSSAPTTGAPTPQSTPYTSSSYPSASSPPSETRGIKEQVPSSESATDSSSLGDTNPYGAYAAYYAQSYSQSTGNPTTVLENSKSIEPSNSNEVESQETVDPEPIVEQETKRQRVE